MATREPSPLRIPPSRIFRNLGLSFSAVSSAPISGIGRDMLRRKQFIDSLQPAAGLTASQHRQSLRVNRSARASRLRALAASRFFHAHTARPATGC
jgi:hypothetical protein